MPSGRCDVSTEAGAAVHSGHFYSCCSQVSQEWGQVTWCFLLHISFCCSLLSWEDSYPWLFTVWRMCTQTMHETGLHSSTVRQEWGDSHVSLFSLPVGLPREQCIASGCLLLYRPCCLCLRFWIGDHSCCFAELKLKVEDQGLPVCLWVH
jgi:hypothetical protein